MKDIESIKKEIKKYAKIGTEFNDGVNDFKVTKILPNNHKYPILAIKSSTKTSKKFSLGQIKKAIILW